MRLTTVAKKIMWQKITPYLAFSNWPGQRQQQRLVQQVFLLITTMNRKGQYFTPCSAYLIWVADAAVLIIAVCPTFYTPCISLRGNFWCWNRFVDLALNYLQISYNYWCVFLFVHGLFLLVVVLVLVVDFFFVVLVVFFCLFVFMTGQFSFPKK